MKNEIIKYLKENTSKQSCWVYWNSLYHAIVPTSGTMLDDEFQISMETLIHDGVVRFEQVTIGVMRFALEETITEILNDKKVNNIREMEAICTELLINGEFEEAEEYRSMIREAKLDTIPTTLEEMEEKLSILVENEDYLKAAEYRDKINLRKIMGS